MYSWFIYYGNYSSIFSFQVKKNVQIKCIKTGGRSASLLWWRMETAAIAPKNVKTMLAWIEAHNRQDMGALDYMHEDVEIVQVATGVVYHGMEQMKKLAAMAYSRRGDKEV